MADAPKKESNDHLFIFDGAKYYLWEIIFVLLISGYFGVVTLNLFNVDVEALWDTIFPFIFIINTLAIILSIFFVLKTKSVKAKIKAIDDESKKKIDEMFMWVNEKPKVNPRWEKIEKLIASDSQSDWKIAILEADSMLDELVEKLGYDGENMGERMLNMNSSNFPYIEEAWRVHKLRNIIAHETSYDLQKGEAEDAIDVYSLIFKSNSFI